MIFTVQKDNTIDNLILSHIKEVVERIIMYTKNPLAIVLIGGYSRGEGSVIRENGEIVPLGDYDFMVIVNSPIARGKEVHLDDLAKKFGIGHIDVSFYWNALLPYVLKKIFWYELKFGSTLLAGSRNVLQAIPISGSRDIDRSEGINLMFNRLDGLLRNFHPRFFARQPSSSSIQRILVFESTKSILACGDSLLVLSHKYHYSYRKRAEIIEEVASLDHGDFLETNPRFLQDYEEATDFKLNPDFGKIKDPVSHWMTARSYLLQGIVYYLKRHAGFETTNQNQLPSALLSLSKFGLRDYLSYNFLSDRKAKPIGTLFKMKRSFSDTVRGSLFLLASAVKEEGVDSDLVDRAMKLIGEISYVDRETARELDIFQSWILARNTIDRAWVSTSR